MTADERYDSRINEFFRDMLRLNGYDSDNIIPKTFNRRDPDAEAGLVFAGSRKI